MMALKLLPILQVIVILCDPSQSYPTVYGTKRYGRLQRSSYQPPAAAAPLLRTTRYPNYYEMYPYAASQNIPEEYYYEPMSYPIYYPRTSKYEVYQAVLPYYYDRPVVHTTGLGYYGYDDSAAEPVEDDMYLDSERKQREDSQTIGQETYFEDDADTDEDNYNYNDVNTAFLNNLIMSQMYKDSLDTANAYGDDDTASSDDDEIYGKIDEFPPNQKPNYFNEDEEVLELKNLAEKHNKLKPDERLRWFQRGANKKNNHFFADDEFSEKKRSVEGHLEWFTDRVDRKPTAKPSITTTASSSSAGGILATQTTLMPKKLKIQQRGQKEEVLPRPATPVKHPFTVPVINNVYKKDRQRQPSVYDTIKHMLDMEKSLEKNGDQSVVKPAMRKRLVSTEDSLTHQLSVLKKHQE